jgi:hypothetical protein
VDHDATRSELHRICTHVLARRRYEVSGRFGLRATPGGIATPAFGESVEVLRVASGHLIREAGSQSSFLPLEGSSLHELAAFAGTDLDGAFSAGSDTPDLGDVHRPVRLVPEILDGLYVGPWTSDRPGDAAYWNVPFGAALLRSELTGGSKAEAECLAFMTRGLELLSEQG